MPRKVLNSRNAQFKKVQSLYRRANRFKYRQAVVEGPQAVREVLLTQGELIRDVYATETAFAEHADVADLVARGDYFWHILPDDLFLQLSKEAQGILAVIDVPDELPLEDLLQPAEAPLLVCALRATDPGNLGTIIRVADACGAGGVITGVGSVEATNPKVLRSSTGSVFHLPVLEHEDITDVVHRAQIMGYQVLAADAHGEYDLLAAAQMSRNSGGGQAFVGGDGLNLEQPTLWLLGNEAHGFTSAELALADYTVRIPMWGRAESLNVAMAATICLYTSAAVLMPQRGQ